MKRHCLHCNQEFFGRSDKKFCSDSCRNTFNNQLNSDTSNLMRNINNVLRKNHRVLSKLNPTGKTKIHRDKLVAKGFNFQYHTSTYTTKAGKQYVYCYDQGYLALDDGYFALVKRLEYVEQ